MGSQDYREVESKDRIIFRGKIDFVTASGRQQHRMRVFFKQTFTVNALDAVNPHSASPVDATNSADIQT